MRAIFVLALAAGLAAAPQTPVRTGLIVGQVLEAGSNRPVPEAIVTLMGLGPVDARDRGRRVMADSAGRYFFGELSPGTYSIRAVKAGYPQNSYGSTHPPLTGGPTPSITLREGERRGDATILLWKYATVSGTVLDEAGEPVIGVDVRALRRSYSSGQLRFIPLNPAISSGRTDDRGAFRLASMPPGDYIVAVPSSQTTMPVEVFTDGLWQGNDEVMNATPEFQVLGYSQNQQIGAAVLMTRSGITWPPASEEPGRMTVYPTTFYPSATSTADATVVSVQPGEERSGLAIQIKAVPAVRVSGRLIGPNGPVPLTALRLSQSTDNLADVTLDPVTGLTDQKGMFTLLGVPPGQYVLRVMTPRVFVPIPPSTPEKPILWASEPLTVGDSDVSGMNITLRQTYRVAGRVEFLGSKPGPSGSPLREIANAFGLYPVAGTWGTSLTAFEGDGTFTTGVAGGSYIFNAEDFGDWNLKAVMFEGRDISDVPLEITGDISGVVIQYSDAVSQIAGTVRSPRGAADPGASVAVFPSDRQRWTGSAARSSRRTRVTPVSIAGTFEFLALPSGEYFVAAIPDALLDTWRDPKVLDTISRTATRISLGENETRTVDLKVMAGR
jgi:hypothetical protein